MKLHLQTSASLIGNSSIKRLHGHGIAYSIIRHLTLHTKWCVNNSNIQTISTPHTHKNIETTKKGHPTSPSPLSPLKTQKRNYDICICFYFIPLQISIECLNSLFSFDTSNKRFNLLRKFFRILHECCVLIFLLWMKCGRNRDQLKAPKYAMNAQLHISLLSLLLLLLWLLLSYPLYTLHVSKRLFARATEQPFSLRAKILIACVKYCHYQCDLSVPSLAGVYRVPHMHL